MYYDLFVLAIIAISIVLIGQFFWAEPDGIRKPLAFIGIGLLIMVASTSLW